MRLEGEKPPALGFNVEDEVVVEGVETDLEEGGLEDLLRRVLPFDLFGGLALVLVLALEEGAVAVGPPSLRLSTIAFKLTNPSLLALFSFSIFFDP